MHRGWQQATSQEGARNTKKIYLLLRLSLAEGSQGEEGYSNDFVPYLDGRDRIFTHLLEDLLHDVLLQSTGKMPTTVDINGMRETHGGNNILG